MASLHIATRGTAALPLDLLRWSFPSLPRATLARLVERAIDRMDEMDGDPDLEDDDPAGDPLDERGEAPDDAGRGILPTLPVYAVDQASLPANVREAGRLYYLSQIDP